MTRETLSVFISLNSVYFRTNEFVSNKVLNNIQDANIVYIPLSRDSFRTIFHTDVGLSDSENANNILEHLRLFFNPNVYNNNLTFASQLKNIIETFYEDVNVNLQKIATDMSSINGPLFSHFFTTNSSNFTKYESECFDADIEFLQYQQTHDPDDCVLCQPIPEVDSTSIDAFIGEFISSGANENVLYLLSSQLKGAITLFSEEYSEQDFWDTLMPNDSISIFTRLFVPSGDNSNELTLIIKFHILKENYTFSLQNS